MRIRLVGKFFDNHSLSIVNRNLVIQFIEAGHEVSLVALDQPDFKYKVEQDLIQALSVRIEKEVIEVDAEIRHSYPPIWRRSNCNNVWFIQPWEYNRAPLEWMINFEKFSGVIVPSEWTKQVYINCGMSENKVKVIPNGYNPLIHYSSERTTKDLRFLYVGSSQKRKGLDVLLSSYIETFKELPNVSLVIRDNTTIYGGDILDQIIKINFHQGTNIKYLNEEYSELEMADLYRSCDYLVHPFRGEGFGMHILEAAICGCTPIVTNGGPPNEFIKGLFINSSVRVTDLVNEMQAIKPGDSLAMMGMHGTVLEPDKNHLSQTFQTIYREKPVLPNCVQTSFNWKEIATKYIEVISE